ncbi:chaperone modulator CbpM [Paucibacter sp. Y2R2-4]|uniref:chaperone modulator CbpM n=1 Tax=Paucibacter sp. Y2R2-4 TaxID=2893553 RepID=UPI0021E3D9C7|nr:chaperone modulator CbpM [Paucibacter sp. Y2R2-4]MCV2348534.1 chaperone modulator CbpM [Paucibacter sp. Y2R2-4]
MSETNPCVMGAQPSEILIVELQLSFSWASLCQASGADRQQLQTLVDEGLLQVNESGQEAGNFSGDALAQTQKALRLAQDLELDLHSVVLVMALLVQIDRLRADLRCCGVQTSA